MQAEDDMVVLVVVDDEKKGGITTEEVTSTNNITWFDFEANDSGYSPMLKRMIQAVEKHGKYATIKESSPKYGSSIELVQSVIKSEPIDDDVTENLEIIEDHIKEQPSSQSDEEIEDSNKDLMPIKGSFLANLKHDHPELWENEKLLVHIVERKMRNVQHPPPPGDYYIMNGVMFECIRCKHLSEKESAATRHYQEKHGERYLVCYACGVTFRSRTNLYKHEKRCVAPDAGIVLRARAAFLGPKGRSRPYLELDTIKKKKKPPSSAKKKSLFPCKLCSATYAERHSLKAHENLHKGERPYLCHACPCAYTSHAALSRHTKKHSNAQFICDHCNRSFKIKEALVTHMDTHKPLRKHGCDECGRRFAQKAALVIHVNKVHRNLPPPCACQMCPKRYPRMSLLKSHMSREHGMSILTRKMFLKSLPKMTDLEIKQYNLKLISNPIPNHIAI